ncbi:MAG: PKD domain-containing protein [Candidatus Marinimicrobia bacterium]|nr:PKD domain-containing protein [Candidatus Neomarinimicrobiota bacterium]
MKNIFFIVITILLVFVSFLFSADIKNVKQIPNGLLYTDEMASTIYLNSNGKISEILSSRGCGYYYNLSPDKKQIGFKLINENGFEAPAIVDIETGNIEKLHESVFKCGQVSFANNGSYAFTVDEELFVINGKNSERYDLGYYANLTPISPDGKFVVFNDDDDQLWLLDLENSNKIKITNSKGGYFNPIWSPDSKKIVFSGINGDLKIYDFDNNMRYDLGKGNTPDWSADSKRILFSRSEVKDLKILNSDIFEVDYDGNNLKKITDTKDVFENTPQFFDGDNSIIYQKKADDIIYKHLINSTNFNKTNKKILNSKSDILNSNCEVNTKYFTEKDLQNTSTLDIPYVHQVYDTPGSSGYYCCAPTTAIMVMAYYNILPKWEVVDNYWGHENDWGSYVNRKYWFNGFYFNLLDPGYGNAQNYGGYGYMWTDGSPNSNMADYYKLHGMTANQTWSTSWNTTTAEIDANRPFSMCVFLTGSGHLIVAKGRLSGKRSIIFNDPYGDKNTSGYPSYDGDGAIYDWPGYNHGHIKLNDGYSSYSAIPWCIATDFDRIAPADSVVDDLQFDIGFFMKTTSPAKMRYWRDAKSGFRNHYWWTYSENSGADVCYTKWTPNLDESGFYEVLAYIPDIDNPATSVPYKIKSLYENNKTVIINQSENANSWVSLGKYFFEKDGSHQVHLGDDTGIDGEKIVFDGIRWKIKSVDIDVTANKFSGSAPFTVDFTGYISELLDSGSWFWDFGDGTSLSEKNPTHTYTSDGIYDLTLTKSYGSINYSITKNNFIMVLPNKIGLSVFADSTDGIVPFTVNFTGGTTYEEDEGNWFWEFGDDSTSTEKNPTHTYTEAGNYSVTLIKSYNEINYDTTLTDYITVGIPEKNKLKKNYPNPFNSGTTIEYELTEDVFVNMNIYNIKGQLVEKILSKNQKAGNHSIVYNANDLPSGIYLYRIQAGKYSETKKFILMK